MCSLAAAPIQMKERLDEQANLLNMPRVGSEQNSAFPFMQLNIVSTQPAGHAGGCSIIGPCQLMLNTFTLLGDKISEERGKVGGKHFDTHDAAGGTTSMITDSDIDPETEDWGWFVVCDLGVAVGA